MEQERSYRENAQQWLDALALMLDRAIYFFDVHQVATATPEQLDRHKDLRSPRNIAGIGVPDVEAYLAWLRSEECLDGMAEADSAAAAHASVPKPERERIEAEERLATIRAFLEAVTGLSNRAVQEAMEIAYRTFGRLRSGV